MLSARTKLLDPSQLEHIEGRMLALNHKLTQAAEKKDALENAEKQTKVLVAFYVYTTNLLVCTY